MFRFTIRKLVWLVVLMPVLALVALQYRDSMRVRAYFETFKKERAVKIEAEAKAANTAHTALQNSE